MRFRDALERALSRAAPTPGAGLVAIAGEEDLDPEVWLTEAEDLVLFDTRKASELEGELGVALGQSALVSASGSDRFSVAKARATELLSGIERIGAACPRLLGGFAFEPGRLGAFGRFGEARLVLPRWRATRARGKTHVELVLRREELAAPHAIVREIAERLAPRGASVGTSSPALAPGVDGAASFLRVVTDAIEAIARGELEKIVVARQARLYGQTSLTRVLSRLALEPETVRFAMRLGPKAFVGATPELLVRSDGVDVVSEAVAGTVPRRGDEAREVRELVSSDKEAREHAYVEAAIREALARAGAEVDPASRSTVRTLRHVHHRVTPIAARASGAHILDLVGALHPTPAVCGVSRERAQRWLAEHERVERGWFAAPFGWLDAEGRGAFVVALRSALLDESGADLFAGAGIVRGSKAERELAETEAKLRAMRSALDADGSVRPQANAVLGGIA